MIENRESEKSISGFPDSGKETLIRRIETDRLFICIQNMQADTEYFSMHFDL